jgi:hypothetical protein
MTRPPHRRAKNVRREESKRDPYDRVLIVCEGKETEPNYFKGLRSYHKLNSADVKIDGKCGSSPDSVFKHATRLWKRERDKGNPYDRVYCVFDKDTHTTYDKTLEKISSHTPKGIFFSAQSVPCFEYWLILHFKFTAKPYSFDSRRRVGDVVKKDLKDIFPDYEESSQTIFQELKDKLETAKQHAVKSLRAAKDRGSDNPSTHVHELVDYLQNLKKPASS